MDYFIYIMAVFLLAGVVHGAGGIGLSTLALALLSLVMMPAQAAALLIVPSLLTNLWPVLCGAPVYPLWERLWPMLAGICVGTTVGATLALDAPWAGGALGATLVACAVLGWTARRWRVAAGDECSVAPAVGVLTGVISAATGVFGLPAVPYLRALALEREGRAQAQGMVFAVATLALAVALAARDAWPPDVAGLSFVAQLPALAGIALGRALRPRLHASLLRQCALLALLLIGMRLAWSAA